MNATPQARRSNLTLWLILAACLLPFIAATGLFYLGPPQEAMNYGDLVEPPRPLPKLTLQDLDGKAVPLASLLGRWTLLHVDESACAEACRAKLYKMRQVRLTQGKNMDRVQRVWVVTDGGPIDSALLQEHAGTVILRDPQGTLSKVLPASGTLSDPIWVVDPLGNIMLRFPRDADPSRMKTDLSRLLRVSRIE